MINLLTLSLLMSIMIITAAKLTAIMCTEDIQKSIRKEKKYENSYKQRINRHLRHKREKRRRRYRMNK